MLLRLVPFAVMQLISLLIFGLVGFIGLGYRKRSLRRIIASLAEVQHPLTALQQFITERTRIITQLVLIVLGLILFLFAASTGILLFIIFHLRNMPRFLDPLILHIVTYNGEVPDNYFIPISIVVASFFLAVLIGFYTAMGIHDMLSAIDVDSEAVRVFEVSELKRDEVIRLQRRQFLLRNLLSVLYWEASAIILLLLPDIIPAIALCALLSALLVVFRLIYAAKLYTLTAALQPIDETKWASLAPRVAAWAALAGCKFASIYIEQNQIGNINVRVLGIRRPMLIVSESFLRSTEWRQQDAMFCIGVGLLKKHIMRTILLQKLIRAVLTYILAMLMFLFITQSFSAVFAFLALTALYVLTLFFRRQLKAYYYGADRMAAFLTGDPLAVMVAINAVTTFNGVKATRKTANMPSTAERLQALDALARQPWQRARQAAEPVPALAPLTVGAYSLTRPWDQPPAPAPVPDTSYAPLT